METKSKPDESLKSKFAELDDALSNTRIVFASMIDMCRHFDIRINSKTRIIRDSGHIDAKEVRMLLSDLNEQMRRSEASMNREVLRASRAATDMMSELEKKQLTPASAGRLRIWVLVSQATVVLAFAAMLLAPVRQWISRADVASIKWIFYLVGGFVAMMLLDTVAQRRNQSEEP